MRFRYHLDNTLQYLDNNLNREINLFYILPFWKIDSIRCSHPHPVIKGGCKISAYIKTVVFLARGLKFSGNRECFWDQHALSSMLL